MVVFAVGNQEKGFAGVVRLTELLHAKVDGVKKCGPTTRRSQSDAVFEFPNVGCETQCYFRAAIELDKSVFVIRTTGLQKGRDRIARNRDFILHAAADVEDDSHADWHFLG